MTVEAPDSFSACVLEGRTHEQTVRIRLAYARLFNSTVLARTAREFGLTNRQAQVAVLLCKGVPVCRIGACLGIAKGTVAVHRRAVYAMMGVRCSEQMICKLILASGLLSDAATL